MIGRKWKNTRAARGPRISVRFFAVLHKTTGSLSKDDGYGNENVNPKYSLINTIARILRIFRLDHLVQYGRTIL